MASPVNDDEDGKDMKKRRSLLSLDILSEGKGTPAEDEYIEDLVGQLSSKRVQLCLDALEELSRLVKDRRLAAALSGHIRALVMVLETREDQAVLSEVLGLLRRLAELGQAEIVGVHAYVFSKCLSNVDIVIARKAAMLFGVVAREGGAALLTKYIPSLADCFQQAQHKITAPLEALQAIACHGESMAVAAIADRLQAILLSLDSRGRGAVCNIFVAIFRGSGANTLYRSITRHSAKENSSKLKDDSGCLLRSLLLIIRDDDDGCARLLAAQTLQSIVLFNGDIANILRSKHSLLMFNCLGTLYQRHDHDIHEAYNIITEIFGLDDISGQSSSGLESGDGLGIRLGACGR
jgi:hypothetical protein